MKVIIEPYYEPHEEFVANVQAALRMFRNKRKPELKSKEEGERKNGKAHESVGSD
ncbi:MAG: hypothetical protein WCP87_04075 [Atribacterota bacterium]